MAQTDFPRCHRDHVVATAIATKAATHATELQESIVASTRATPVHLHKIHIFFRVIYHRRFQRLPLPKNQHQIYGPNAPATFQFFLFFQLFVFIKTAYLACKFGEPFRLW